MKRNFFTLAVFITIAVLVILMIKSKNRLRSAGTSQAPTIVTQEGAMMVMQPQPAAQPMIIATLPNTNVPSNPTQRK
jgi:hypothetical protein